MLWIEKPYTKIACISDPHAHLATLQALIAQIPPDYIIIILGDMIDKGKKAKEVVQMVKDHHEALLGNHDHLMTVESNPKTWKHYQSLWLENNGRDTHKSYGDKWKIQNIKENKVTYHQHVVYLKSLPMVIELPNLMVRGKPVVLSHSTISKAVAYFGGIDKVKEELNTKPRGEYLSDFADKKEVSARKAIQSILWEVVGNVTELPDLGVYNVFGHTVQDQGIQIGDNGAIIDCGVYVNNTMSALLLPELKIITQVKIPD